METINNNSDNEKYTECLTTYDQIIDAAGHLTSQLEFYRERMIKGSIEPSVAKSWIRRYNKAINRFIGYKPTLYDILDYIKETIYIIDVEEDLVTLTLDSEYTWSTEKIKREYPQFKEILEISDKLQSVFSGIDMLTIPIHVPYPRGYDDYFWEIFKLEEEEQKQNEDKK
jgi:hypothetical protein